MAVTTKIFDKAGLEHVIPALYSELPYFFKLITTTQTYAIEEPISFDQIDFVADRDKEWHGFNYESTDDKHSLSFDCASGGDIIRQVYEQDGNDGEVYLQYGVIYNAQPIIEFEYKIDFNTYTYIGDKNMVQCQVETRSLHELVRSRWDTKLNLLDNKDLDNKTIPVVGTFQLPFLSKEVSQKYENVVTASAEADLQFNDKDNRSAYIIFGSEEPTKDEISIIPKYPMGVFEGSDGNPLTNDMYFLKASNAGIYTFDINHQFQFTCNITRHVSGSVISFSSWSLKVCLAIKRADGSATTVYDLLAPSGSTGTNGDNRQVVQSLSLITTLTDLNLKANDKVFYYCRFEFTASTPVLIHKVNTYVHVVNINQSIKVNALTTAKTTFGKSVFIGDAIKKAFEMVTGKAEPVRTRFYSLGDDANPINGCGARFVITNGFQIRNFDSANRPIRTSLNEIMNSLKAIHCIGMSYEYDGTNEIVKIEPAESFYKDVEILKIDNCQEYQEVAAKELVFNQIEVGYEKFLDEGTSGLEDFHTKQEYQTPIKSQANKKSILSKFIASGEVIEKTRREQFAEKPTDSTTYDDNIFIIGTVAFASIEIVCDFDREEYTDALTGMPVYTYRIVFSHNYDFINVGAKIIITDSIGNDGTYTIKEVYTQSNGKTYTIVEEPVWTEVLSSVFISFPGTTIQPENQERINVIAGSGADVYYNLAITPKRMLLNHAKFINSGLRYKSGSDVIKLTDIKGKGEITTQFKTVALCNTGDPDKHQLTEKDNISLSHFDGNSKLFSPEFINFTTSLSREEIRYINNALRGRNTEGKNYGYISVRNPRSESYTKVYINSMKFNPLRGDVKFQTVKKKP